MGMWLGDVYNHMCIRWWYVLLCMPESKSTRTHVLQSYERTNKGCKIKRTICTSYIVSLYRTVVRERWAKSYDRTILPYEIVRLISYDRTIRIVRSYDFDRTIVRLNSLLIVRPYALHRTIPYVYRTINLHRIYVLLALVRPIFVRNYCKRTTFFNGMHEHLTYEHTVHVYSTIKDYRTSGVRPSFKRMIVRCHAKCRFHTSTV
jgi:hypothetical protein